MPGLHSGFLPLVFAVCMGILPCSSLARDNPIVIGQAIDLSSANGSIGRDYVAGIKTHFDAVNAAGGINGRRIVYLVRDDHGQAAAAEEAVAELIDRDRADIILGGVGDAVTQAVAGAPAFKRSGLTLFAPLASRTGNEDAKVVYWRPGYQQEIRYLLTYFEKLGITNLGIVYLESPPYQHAFQSVSAEAQRRGFRIADTARISRNGSNVEAEAKRLAAAKPGFVLAVADTIAAGLFLKSFRQFSPHTIVAGDSLINLETLRELAGAARLEWTVFSQVVSNPNASQTVLQMEHARMMKKYRDEEVSALTLEGFAVAKTLTSALRQTGASRSALQDLVTRQRTLDLGGFTVGATRDNQCLSSYLDIALYRKGSQLVF